MKRIRVSIVVTMMIWIISGAAAAGINDGLVLYLPFNGNAYDESGNENHGTVHGAALVPDRFGNAQSAYSFDGVDDYLSLTESQTSITRNLSISVWIKNTDELFSDTYSNRTITKGPASSAPWDDFAIYLPPDPRQVWFTITNESGDALAVSTDLIDNNRYYHVVGVYDYDNSNSGLGSVS